MKQNWGYRDSSPQRMFTALVEDLSFFLPKTHLVWSTTTYNFSTRGPMLSHKPNLNKIKLIIYNKV